MVVAEAAGPVAKRAPIGAEGAALAGTEATLGTETLRTAATAAVRVAAILGTAILGTLLAERDSIVSERVQAEAAPEKLFEPLFCSEL
jgi:hypothetical protein